MRILVISKYYQHEDAIRNQLSQVSERDSIVFVYSYSAGKEFIQNHIEKQQEALDLIIIYSSLHHRDVNDFKNWLKNDDRRTFSKRDFKLRTIPLALFVEKNENKNAFKGYNITTEDIGYEKISLHVNKFVDSVKEWRSHVLDEMDNLGIKSNSGSIDYTYYFSSQRKRKISTAILSENFKIFPRKLNYYWLNLNSEQIQKSIDGFIKLLKRTEAFGKKREEKLYQKFFVEHQHFLLRDNYTRSWYESKLEKENNTYEEPDFALKPNFKVKTDLSLLEIKLPNEGFIKNKKYHKAPLTNFVNHIIQVNDYKDYLESQRYKEAINKIYGFIPSKVEYQLLIGRQQDKLEKLSELNKVMRQLGQNHIQLLTYDELMEYQVKFMERIGILEIK